MRNIKKIFVCDHCGHYIESEMLRGMVTGSILAEDPRK